MENHSIFVAFAPMENQKIAACDWKWWIAALLDLLPV
jgi:hypothetical protein